MFGTHNLALFVVSGILLNLTPGQDTMYILGCGLWQGRTAAIVSALGIATGGAIHNFAAALGVSAILASSATAFTIVKWIGAVYLGYLGVRTLASRSGQLSISQIPKHANLRVIYRQAILTNVLNPKVAMFFMAFLPQFVDPATPHRVLTFVFLGTCFIATGTAWCLILACVTFPLKPGPAGVILWRGPRRARHGSEASFGGRGGQQAAAGGRGDRQGHSDRRGVQAHWRDRGHVLPLA